MRLLQDLTDRIPWGGAQASELMLKMAQLKYPSFPTKVTLPQATVSLKPLGLRTS